MFNFIFSDDDLKKKNIIGLNSELKSLFLYNSFIEREKSILLVTNNIYEANIYYQTLTNYTDDVLLFPMDDFLTSQALAISPEMKNTRLETILSLIENNHKIVITNLMGYLRFLPTKDIFIKKSMTIFKNSTYKINELVENLIDNGYEKTSIVNKTGEFAARGFVLDVFPINTNEPIRIEFWGDIVESIKSFDINNQLSNKEVKEINIFVNTESLTDKKIDTFGLKHHEIMEKEKAIGISSFFNKENIFYDNYERLTNTYNLLVEEMFNYCISSNLKNDTTFMNDFYQLKSANATYFDDFETTINQNKEILSINVKEILPFSKNKEVINERLKQYIKKGKKVIICIDNRYKINNLIEFLENKSIVLTNENNIIDNKINIINKKISNGFEIGNYIVISESEFLNTKKSNTEYHTKFKLGTRVRDVKKLNIGDYVVHIIHGIGRYCGIKSIVKNDFKKDYLYLEYSGNDKLYVPVEKIEFISKYSSNEGITPRLTKLGGLEWKKTKLKARKKAEDIAKDLLKLYAQREVSKGFSFNSDDQDQEFFEKEFTFVPTEDQLKVIDEIKGDMEKETPMDRLLCGDVGFGKTEVAFRAIFKAILSSKQVALLCPTTILSNQHYNNAIERFKSYPVNIALLNRFVSSKKIKEYINKIKEGKVDIVIGTHRLLSEDVVFNNLGLLVIDEEQRFGVKHKEKIKQYKKNIDVLTLTATPIPRTLQMSMAGVRNLSLIETPPTNRYPIQTYVLAENDYIIKDAIYKELSRNGQVYILYNNINEMDSKLNEICRLVPEARITCAHGKMNRNEIENIMIKFINHEYDILLCTTIIETGIDIPNVNTLIIIDADRFGLSQLYQIRGRVGRSDKIAYCYLMYNKHKILSEVATKRLKVIKDFTELGSGFSIAMRDLSIRGAGDLLGSEQAGFVDSVGIDLFLKMLNEEILIQKGEKIERSEDSGEQPLLDVSTTIDDSYVSDEELKIEIHDKINTINSYDKLEQIKKELENRFGKLPNDIIIYMYEELFEYLARKTGLNNIKQTKNYIEIIFSKSLTNKIEVQNLFLKTSELSRMFRFSMKREQLIITLDIIKLDKHFIYYLLELIKIIEELKKQ